MVRIRVWNWVMVIFRWGHSDHRGHFDLVPHRVHNAKIEHIIIYTYNKEIKYTNATKV